MILSFPWLTFPSYYLFSNPQMSKMFVVAVDFILSILVSLWLKNPFALGFFLTLGKSEIKYMDSI